MSAKDLREAQAKRSALFPSDRIAFRSAPDCAHTDQMLFRHLIGGRITLEECCEKVAKNNYLEVVTPEQLLNEMRIIGWIRQEDK